MEAIGLESLVPYLIDPDGLGAVVAEALACFPEHASRFVPAIDQALLSASEDGDRQILEEWQARLSAA